MIKNIVELLSYNDYYGISERVEIAKGKYHIPYSFSFALQKIKRLWLIRKSK